MKKLLLSFVAILFLASFTAVNDPITLKDIDGTLLKSYVTLKAVNHQFTATFKVDANTLVTSFTDNEGTHIYLVENGHSGINVEHTITFSSKSIDFDSYFNSGANIASTDGALSSNWKKRKRPRSETTEL